MALSDDIRTAYCENVKAYAYLLFASVIRNMYIAGFGAFVDVLPRSAGTGTGLMELNSTLTSNIPFATGKCSMSSLGLTQPLFGWFVPPTDRKEKSEKARSFVPPRIAAEVPHIHTPKVEVRMEPMLRMAQGLLRSNVTKVEGKCKTHRMASEEPETKIMLDNMGLVDVDVTHLHIAEVISNFVNKTSVFYKMRSRLILPDARAVKSM
jgi:hypothetical protein